MLSFDELLGFIRDPLLKVTIAAIGSVLAVLFLHGVGVAIFARLFAGQVYPLVFLRRAVAPLRLLLPALALQAVWAAAPAGFPWLGTLRHTTLLINIGAATWLAVNVLVAIRDLILLRFPADTPDNLQARRIITQANILMRTLSGAVVVIGLSAGMMTFPDVRQIGTSLIASAGLAGLAVGFAAKPVLGNLIAGLQIAMTQPIRLDDVLIIENEWGRVDEITGAYVVLKIWDERRLIIPLQWFIEHPFQNWTRKTAHIIGTVSLWVDYCMPVEVLRRETEAICRAAPEWDGEVCVLQVVDASERAMQVRALVSANDSGLNWDLRCRLREGMIAFIQREYPACLPHLRTELVPPPPAHREVGAGTGVVDESASAKSSATPERRRTPRGPAPGSSAR